MNRITFDSTGNIRPIAVILVGLALSAIALSVDLLIADAAPGALAPSGELPTFGFSKILLASVPAVLGNTLGFYMSYRSPRPRALGKFLAPAGGFFVAFMVPPVWTLIADGGLATFAVSAALNAAPVAIAVSALLLLRPGARAARGAAMAPIHA